MSDVCSWIESVSHWTGGPLLLLLLLVPQGFGA